MSRAADRVHKALRLPLRQQVAILAALPLVVVVHVVVKVLPYPVWVRLLRPTHARRSIVAITTAEIGEAVRHAASVVPHTRCLVSTIVGQILFRVLGHAAVVRIGVAPSTDGRLHAHSWTVSPDGTVVLGYLETLNRFAPFPLGKIAHIGFHGVRPTRATSHSRPMS